MNVLSRPWGLWLSYGGIAVLAFSAIWGALEPAGVPDTFQTLPDLLYHRLTYHIALAVVVTPHILLVLLYLRSKSSNSVPGEQSIASERAIATALRESLAQEKEHRTSAERERVEAERQRAEMEQSLTRLEAELEAYKGLESQIIALLAGGEELSASIIAMRLGLSDATGQQKVRASIAKLVERGALRRGQLRGDLSFVT